MKTGEKPGLRICEVGPRDGLQNEKSPLTTADKAAFIDDLHGAGIRYLEAGSFVSPKAVPAMADTGGVIGAVRALPPGGLITALIMNGKGLDRALEAGVGGVAIVCVVSETMCEKNNRRTVQAALDTALELTLNARRAGLRVRADVATAWHCPYEGKVAMDAVLAVADPLCEAGVDELCFCDTDGAADPAAVLNLLQRAVPRYGAERLGVHFHDTRGFALANATVALQQGITLFDAAAGGLGGCPFAPGARGNLATEDLVLMAGQMGYATGISLPGLWSAVDRMGRRLGRQIGGRSGDWYRQQTEEKHA